MNNFLLPPSGDQKANNFPQNSSNQPSGTYAGRQTQNQMQNFNNSQTNSNASRTNISEQRSQQFSNISSAQSSSGNQKFQNRQDQRAFAQDQWKSSTSDRQAIDRLFVQSSEEQNLSVQNQNAAAVTSSVSFGPISSSSRPSSVKQEDQQANLNQLNNQNIGTIPIQKQTNAPSGNSFSVGDQQNNLSQQPVQVSQALTTVCIECGAPSKIVRNLQNDNYCLEKCKRCSQTADKYVEYDSNLKMLSVLLCFIQIHRHIFFNVEKIKNLKIKCYCITFFLLFLFYLHESKANYRKYLEEKFIAEVRELKMREFKLGRFINNTQNNITTNQSLSVQSLDEQNTYSEISEGNKNTPNILSEDEIKQQSLLSECEQKYGDQASKHCSDLVQDQQIPEPDFYQLQKILQEALKNIDEEKLYTKHIFDRFDLEALITTVFRKGSYIAFIIGLTYIVKRIQMNYQNNFYQRQQNKRRVVLDSSFELFYRIWFCVIISQITFSGIIVEIIWSYNQYNFFFWLQIYSGYSVYTCLRAMLLYKYDKYIPIVIIVLSIIFSRVLHLLILLLWSGLSFLESLYQLPRQFETEIEESYPEEWIGP